MGATDQEYVGNSSGDTDDLLSFIRLDRLGAGLGTVTVVFANTLFLQEPALWVLCPLLLILIGALVLAERQLAQGQVMAALVLVTVPNWIIAFIVSLLLPFLWPVMALTVLMPLVAATPHLSRRNVLPAVVVAAIVAAVVAGVGLLRDDEGVIEDIDDTFEFVLVISALIAQIIPIGLLVSRHNLLQRTQVDRLQLLNEYLTVSERDLAASRQRVVNAADEERRRIERDLHDGAQQRLVALGVRLRLLQSQTPDNSTTKDTLNLAVSELEGATDEIRELAHGIYPPLLQTRGLGPALTAVARRSPFEVQTQLDEIERFDEAIETALYFVALEALTNVGKYAPRAVVELELTKEAAHVVLTVSDDGPGFETAGQHHSRGTQNMSDRLAVVGGLLSIDSAPGKGTVVRATAPWEPM